MLSRITELALMVLQLFGWLFVILPFFDTIHHRFFQSASSYSNSTFLLSDWYYAFFKALRQRAAIDPPAFLIYSRRGLLFVSLSLTLMALSTVPLSSGISLNGQHYFLDNGSAIFSVLIILAFAFCAGISSLLLGYTLKKNFVGLSSIENSMLRQSTILMLAFAVITTPFVEWDTSMRHLINAQITSKLADLPAWGALTNPVAFVCACVAMAVYLRQWQEENYPSAFALRKSLQGELSGTELVTFRVVRSLEFLLLYTIIVVVFLGGPFLMDPSIGLLLSLFYFTAKLTLLVFVVLSIQYLLPQMQNRQMLRVLFLIVLPLEMIGYPMSLALCQWLNVS